MDNTVSSSYYQRGEYNQTDRDWRWSTAYKVKKTFLEHDRWERWHIVVLKPS